MPHIFHRDDVRPALKPGWRTLNLVPDEISQEIDAELTLHVVSPGATTPRHYHPAGEHYIFVVRGVGRIEQNDGEHPIQAGCLIAVDEAERHAITNDGPGDMELLEFLLPAGASVTIDEEAP